ncbi:MAG: ribosome biogenesis protein ytm1 [Icmadophila ericetorum]|nr:ribosome biogenesis protein ytm1 [Icmadophila ericetorum]
MDTTALESLDTSNHGAMSQVKLQLSTRQLDISLPENTGSILVNTNLRRYALSTLVNALLENEKSIPFEFLINGTFLRTSIDEYLTANGISSETTLSIEYVRAIIPPLYLASFEHDDWVSSVDVLSSSSPGRGASNAASSGLAQGRILSGSYDGLLRVWNMSSEVIAQSPSMEEGGHASSIKAALYISPTKIASSGLDRTIRLWKYSEDVDGFKGVLSPQIELYGHKASIDFLAMHPSSSHLLSASADHSVGIWSTKKSDAPPAPPSLLLRSNTKSSKRRKIITSTLQRGPLSLLKAHTAPVSSTIFAPKDATVAYSASLDHTVRTWDLPTTTLVDTRTTSHSLLSLTALQDLNLLAVGTSARHITLIDPRDSATITAVMTLRGHTNAVVTLACDPESTYGLLSGSHDGTCKIWDVRSSKKETDGVVGESIYTIQRESVKDEEGRRVGGEGVKVFGVVWDREVGIVSVGEDKRVQINRGKGVTQRLESS